MKRKTRKPFKMRTRNGSIIDVTPTHPKRIPMLKKNVSERTVIELYAEPPAARSGEKRGSDEVNGHL